MYRFYINKASNIYHFEELIRIFMAEDLFEAIALDMNNAEGIDLTDSSYLINRQGSQDQELIKRELFGQLSKLTGERPLWGTLTGVRPLKPIVSALESTSDLVIASKLMADKYLVSDKKIQLLSDIAEYQRRCIKGIPYEKAGLYVGIPFCPTICSYCSFSSSLADPGEIDRYLDKLLEEIRYVGERFNVPIETVYIGGGTPTTLNPTQLSALITQISDSFSADPHKIEFTIEAGRPDTIDYEKLYAIRSLGVDRISINPQSLNDKTLALIERKHSSDDIYKAYEIANKIGFGIINSDLIAGLPGETVSDFENTLDEIINLGANNVTVHTLSVKRGSALHESDPEYYRRYADTVSEMLNLAEQGLRVRNFNPYYIYRQKHQIGAFENVGWCLPETHSVYNVRIMEDRQTVVALGAGAIGKVYFPDEDRLERIPNVSNYKIYIERFDEMIDRKKGYF